MSTLSGDEAAACAQALASKRLLAEAGLVSTARGNTTGAEWDFSSHHKASCW